jgi:cell division transport system ATP-binding protein
MVRFIDVTKVFPNGYIGLESVSFAIEPGEMVYLVGESGAGKTTLMRLLIREMLPTSGEIYVGEDNILEVPNSWIPQLRRKIGVVFQDYQLIPDRTIDENVSLVLEIMRVPKDQLKQRVQDVLELVGIPDKRFMFPVQLSGGELQRAAIARALVTAPAVLFADEPTGNLDPETGKGIMELLKKVQDLGTTVLVATHDQVALKNFPSRQLRIQQGKLIEDSQPGKKSKNKEGEKTEKTSVNQEEAAQDEMKKSDKKSSEKKGKDDDARA